MLCVVFFFIFGRRAKEYAWGFKRRACARITVIVYFLGVELIIVLDIGGKRLFCSLGNIRIRVFLIRFYRMLLVIIVRSTKYMISNLSSPLQVLLVTE